MKAEYTTVSSKGQLVLPARLRRRLGIKKGTRLTVFEDQGRLILEPVSELVDRLMGCLKGEPSLLEYWEQEHRKDRY